MGIYPLVMTNIAMENHLKMEVLIGTLTINGVPSSGFWGVPSGKRLHNYGKIHHV